MDFFLLINLALKLFAAYPLNAWFFLLHSVPYQNEVQKANQCFLSVSLRFLNGLVIKCKFSAIARHIWMRFNFLFNYHYYKLQKCWNWINILHQSDLRKSHATRLKCMNKIPFISWNNTYVISKGYKSTAITW